MLRAEILAEGVRDELPQPLVSARTYKPELTLLLQLLLKQEKNGVRIILTFGADKRVLYILSYRCCWEG